MVRRTSALLIFLGSIRTTARTPGLPLLWSMRRLIPQEASPGICLGQKQASRERAEANKASVAWAGNGPNVTSATVSWAKEATGCKVLSQGAWIQGGEKLCPYLRTVSYKVGETSSWRNEGLEFNRRHRDIEEKHLVICGVGRATVTPVERHARIHLCPNTGVNCIS